MLSWVVFTLPYIEEQNLANLFDMKRDVVSQPADPQATVLPAMLCPSDDSRDLHYAPRFPFFRGKRFAKGNYAAFVSPFHVELHPWFPGALVAGKTWKVKNIVDGPSHTLMLSEVRVRQHPEDQRGAWALPWNGSSLLAFDMHPPDDYTLDSPTFTGSDVSLGFTQPPNNRGANVDMLYDCPAADLAKLAEWIDLGAAYDAPLAGPDPKTVAPRAEDHWSFKPIKSPAVPRSGNEIDSFILAKLDRAGLKPAKTAEKTPLGNMWVAVAEKFDIEVESVGGSNGKVSLS
jgi:hypothetical protein